MGLFSFFRKNQQKSSAGSSDFYSRSDEDAPSGRGKRKGSKRDEPVDPVLPEKKRARRRLVGAIALVLAVVIGLPMILDSEPKPLSDDINIQIPSRDTPVAAVRQEPASAAETEQDAAQGAEAEEDAPVKAVAPEPAPPKAEPQTKPPAASTEQKPTVAPKAEAPAPKPAVPSAETAQHAADEARARAILEGKPVAAAPKASGKVAIQVAALASQDKVNELQKKLQGAGLKTYTQKVATASGDRIRVRVGPFANEAEAEKARAKLTKLGLTGKLIPL